MQTEKSKKSKITLPLKREIIRIVDERLKDTLGRDIKELRLVVYELAQAQKRTEQRVEELAQAQKKTEQRLEELAQAQKKTEERLEELAQAQKKTEQ
ncbi:MAG: hypothetical protein ACK4TF_06015, partial [Thermodesulfovibrionales bacterium]